MVFGVDPSPAQADFYSMQPLGNRYIYASDYFEDPREIVVYQNGVDGGLSSDSVMAVYVMDAQYPPTFNLFCSTFELIYPDVACVIVGISNFERQSELTPPYTDSSSVAGYDDPGHGKEMLLSLETEIIPFIQSKYHAGHKRILVGHSLGGTFVTYALTENPEMFPCVISVSANYGYSNDMILDRLSALRTDNDRPLYLYLAGGHSDRLEENFKPQILKAHEILGNKTGVNVFYDSLNINKHSDTILEGYFRGLQNLSGFVRSNGRE